METYYWNECIKEAKKAFAKDEVPVGCIIVKNDEIIAKAHNLKEKQKDTTAHAEILAIKKAQKKLNDWRLTDCIMYSSLEPCPMCAGAILHARLKKIIYGAVDPKWGAESKLQLFSKKHFNHQIAYETHEITECSDLLKKFFKSKRK